MENLLYKPYQLGQMTLQNRIVMAPMTRCRAIGNTANELIAEYYAQRSGAGLILTEGTSPSPNGLGYARIPGLFNIEQVKGWRTVTDAVHAKNSKIFVQLMHAGRVASQYNLPKNAQILAPSATPFEGEIWTDQMQMQAHGTPKEMSLDDIESTIKEYVYSARLAIEAGFDGIELHGANGYLIEQFINPTVNMRSDIYGGSIENRLRFVTEIAKQTADAIGGDKVGIRISPYGVYNGMGLYGEVDETYTQLATILSSYGLLYIHIVDHSTMGSPALSPTIKQTIRKNFKGTLILSGGYDAGRAEQDLQESKGDLVSFGRFFLSNPDLVERFKSGASLQEPDPNTFYTADAKGYTDYLPLSI